MVTLRQIRYFVTVAEELSFVRAAARLHVSQPPLSSQIKALEDDLAVQLLQRDTRTVQLTGAGRAFLQGSQRMLADLRRTVQEAARIAAGEVGTLRLGVVGTSVFSVLPGIVDCLARALPDVELAVAHQGSREQHQALLRGDIDIALFHAPLDDAALQVVRIFRDRFCVILPPGHPLARREDFALALLRDEPFVTHPRSAAPLLFDSVVGACVHAGFSPRVRHTGDFLAMVEMVAMGLGVALVPQSLAERSRGLVAVRALEDTPVHIGIDLAWKREDPAPVVQRATQAITAAYPLPR